MDYNNWYLVRLIKHNKIMFVVLFLFCCGEMFFNHVKIHSFPWYVWDMYSKIEQVPDTVNLNIVYLDNEPYDYMQLPFWSNIAVRKTSDYYNRMLYRRYIDPFAHSVNRRTRHLPDFLKHYTRKRLINTEVNASQYPEWLFGFLDRQTGGGLERLDLIKQYYIYRNGNYLPLEKSDTLFVVKKPSSHE